MGCNGIIQILCYDVYVMAIAIAMQPATAQESTADAMDIVGQW